VTKANLVATKVELERTMARVERRLTLRVLVIVGAFHSGLFVLLRFVP